MKYDEIKNLYFYLCNRTGYDIINYDEIFVVLIKKYNIQDINEKISIRKAIEFIKDVWEIDFYFYDKFVRYARKFDLIIEEEKIQRNWKLRITYDSIFKLMMMPLYELFKVQMKKESK